MKYLARALMACVAASAVAAPALGADYVEPVVVEAPEPAPAPVAMGGWYIRGDIGYAWNKFRGSTYHIDACGTTCATVEQTGTLNGELKGAFTLGGGIGYHINHYLRADLTLDHTFKSDFTGSTTGTCTRSTGPGPDGVLGTADDIIGTATCTSSDTASFSAMALMANAYVDFGNFGKIKPYVGAGIGGARVTWSDLSNTIPAGFHQSGTT
ncbi:MAG TPA: outer membrane beta-barrel protein, partial [Rhizobiaceae bacterium]|nr:outer membrane beta-barrel protein [Rhizobiaceae bacterium]